MRCGQATAAYEANGHGAGCYSGDSGCTIGGTVAAGHDDRSGRISFASLEIETLHGDPAQTLRDSMVPGTPVTRYERDWRMGQWRQEGRYVFGRIGFQRPGGVAELWDESINDFREQVIPAGQTSPFAVNVETLRVAFQLRSGWIRPTTFTGALQALLNEASNLAIWRVRHEVVKIPWERWRAEVSRVTRLEFRLKRPNPNYTDREFVERLVEDTQAGLVALRLAAREDAPGGIDLDTDIIRQAIDHTQRGYGTLRARGEGSVTTEGGERVRPDREGTTQWESTEEGVAPVREVSVDPDTGDAGYDALKRELEGEPNQDE